VKYVNQVKNPHGTVVVELLSDPHFTFKNVLGAVKVETQNGKIKAEIPLKGLFFLPYNLVIYSTRFRHVVVLNTSWKSPISKSPD